MTALDLIAIGRVSVDLYGQQIGSRLEDVTTLAKAVGGCPANVVIGTARLGLKSALISRVGDEPMGRFVREQLEREGVDASCVAVDPRRLTALVLLSVRDANTFPLIFYRENCADSALDEGDVDPEFVASSRALLITGTHLSLPQGASAQRKAQAIARRHDRKVILDIDYRPNLWGIGGHGAGESRYARCARVTASLAPVLPDCDLIVGTEEELHIASGCEDTLEAVRHIRGRSDAVILCKRGARGCVVLAGPVPRNLEDALVVRGREIEIYNVLGAGDAFLAGYLSGYLRGESHEVSAQRANACGAIAVSRLLCSSEFPSLAELNHYLAHGSAQRALRGDARLTQLHWATTRRRREPATVLALALDQDAGLVPGSTAPAAVQHARIEQLAITALSRVAAGREGFGLLLAGAPAMQALPPAQLWVARRVDRTDSASLEFLGAGSLAVYLTEWPTGITIKCRCLVRADEAPALRTARERNLVRLAVACRAQGRELLIEVEARGDVAPVLERLYGLGVCPDWWQLSSELGRGERERCADLIRRNDEFCRGIIVTLQGMTEELPGVEAMAGPLVRGCAAGGTILGTAASSWLAGQISEETAIEAIAQRVRSLAAIWSEALAVGTAEGKRIET
jgi:5-dehydro-2-deoxygluconokinase